MIAIKYSEEHKKSKKLQLEFRDRDTFDNCISYFDLWSIPKKILDSQELDISACSQFTQASQQSVEQFNFSQQGVKSLEPSQAEKSDHEEAEIPLGIKDLKRNSVTWSQNLLDNTNIIDHTKQPEIPDYGNPTILANILEKKLQDPNFIDLVSF